MSKKTVIIGGVAGGATAAARLRRRDESMEIVMLERGEYISYANCGLPYYIGDVIKSREALLLQTPQQMEAKFGVSVRTRSEAIKINRKSRTVTVKNTETGEIYEESYDNLVIATGSSPLVPPIPGIDGPDIYTLWTVPDTDRIKEALTEKKPRSAAVIGGGFIGLEMAENLREAGLEVTLIEMQNQVMAPLDFEMAQLLHENITDNQVNLILEDGVSSFERENGRTKITLNSKKTVVVDMVLLSIGIKPNSSLAREAGLELNGRGGIVTDEYMRTSDENIYAVGDVIQIENFVLKSPGMIPLAGPANKQARICADNIAGDHKKYRGTLGASVAKVFDYTAAAVGVNEKTLRAEGKKKGEDYFAVLINQKSHAGYYPSSVPLTLKLLFQRDGTILGAQIVGQDGADKRIDTIASAMRLGGSIHDLAELELAYAPPYSSAKDPVNMLGFVAENVLDGLVQFITWEEMDRLASDESTAADMTILDVTEELERMADLIPGSYHIPLGQLRSRMGELDKNKLIVPYCAVGVRSYNAARILMQNGFSRVRTLEGGLSFYRSMHYRDGKTEEKSLEPCGGDTPCLPVSAVDCCGLQCPGPIMKVNQAVSQAKEGEIIKATASDLGFSKDIASWCSRTGNTLVKTEKEGVCQSVYIQKGTGNAVCTAESGRPDGKTIVVFSGDLDKVLASFIIADGAAAMGRKVTMFFTFWGLNVLRKPVREKVKKSAVERMFGAMMPRGAGKLKLSRLNMAGAGTKMMRRVMKKKHVDSLEELMKKAMASGVRFVACTMSMDVMGIRREELIDGVEFAGVASYLGDAEGADVNLFV